MANALLGLLLVSLAGVFGFPLYGVYYQVIGTGHFSTHFVSVYGDGSVYDLQVKLDDVYASYPTAGAYNEKYDVFVWAYPTNEGGTRFTVITSCSTVPVAETFTTPLGQYGDIAIDAGASNTSSLAIIVNFQFQNATTQTTNSVRYFPFTSQMQNLTADSFLSSDAEYQLAIDEAHRTMYTVNSQDNQQLVFFSVEPMVEGGGTLQLHCGQSTEDEWMRLRVVNDTYLVGLLSSGNGIVKAYQINHINGDCELLAQNTLNINSPLVTMDIDSLSQNMFIDSYYAISSTGLTPGGNKTAKIPLDSKYQTIAFAVLRYGHGRSNTGIKELL